jgi:hypothetical protein
VPLLRGGRSERRPPAIPDREPDTVNEVHDQQKGDKGTNGGD